MSFAVATHTDLGLEPENAGRMDVFHELLSTLAGVLDVRDVFQRLSAVAARVIPHDEADLALLAEDGAHFRLYASTRAGEPELVYVPDPGSPAPTSLEDLSARITLRLPETLKTIVDAAAQEAGVSANTWLLQQITRSADPKRRPHKGGRRMTGYGQG